MRPRNHRIPALILIMLLSTFVFNSAAAMPQAQFSIAASEDTWIDIDYSTTNFNAQFLRLSYSGPPTPTLTRVVLLKFSIGENPLAGNAIEQARLTLATIGLPCGTPASAQSVALYGMTSTGWTEGAANWSTASGLRGGLLDTSDTTLPATGHVTWTDAGAGAFAAYLENARLTNGGVVGLWLEMTGSDGISVSGTMEDSELTGASSSCPGADLPPTLELAGDGQPLAVTLADLSAAEARNDWPLLVGAGLSVALAAAFLIIGRGRAA